MDLAFYQSLQSTLLSAMVWLPSLTTHKHLPQSCNEWHQLYGQAAKIYKWCRMAQSLRATKSDDASLSLIHFLSHGSELQLNRVFMNFKRYFFLFMTDNSISHTGYSHKAASVFHQQVQPMLMAFKRFPFGKKALQLRVRERVICSPRQQWKTHSAFQGT